MKGSLFRLRAKMSISLKFFFYQCTLIEMPLQNLTLKKIGHICLKFKIILFNKYLQRTLGLLPSLFLFCSLICKVNIMNFSFSEIYMVLSIEAWMRLVLPACVQVKMKCGVYVVPMLPHHIHFWISLSSIFFSFKTIRFGIESN